MWDEAERKRLFVEGLRIRAVASAAFGILLLGGALWGWRARIEGYDWLLSVLGFLVLVNPILWAIGAYRRFPLKDFYFHWALDVLAVTLIVYLFGVFDTPLAPAAYMIMIVSSGAFMAMNVAFILATMSSTAWIALWFLTSHSFLPHWHAEIGGHLSGAGELFLGISSVVFFYVFAYAGGSIAEKLRHKTESLLANQAELGGALDRERTTRQEIQTISALVQHDIYGPLAAVFNILRQASVALERAQTSEAGLLLEAGSQRLRGIESAVQSLGLFSGPADVNRGQASILASELFRNLLDDLRPEILEKRLMVSIGGIDAMLQIDRNRLYHVMRNLLSNAIKCVAEFEGKIVVDLSPGRPGGIVVAISDNGPGLSPRFVAALTRADPPVADKTPGDHGLGVGLYLSRSLVAGWGGAIGYSESEMGGSRLTVWVPATAIAAPTESIPERAGR